MPNLTDELIACGLMPAPQSGPRPPLNSPTIQPGYYEPRWYGRFVRALKRGPGACLFGPAGCGKTEANTQAANSLGASRVLMACAAGMQVDHFIGTVGLKAGNTVLNEGPLVLAWRAGLTGLCVLQCEEANMVHIGVWSIVNTLTDRSGNGLRLPTGEVIPFSPGFRMVLCYNEGYGGTKEINQALRSRLKPISCDYLPPDLESRLLADMTGCDAQAAERVASLAVSIRAAALRLDVGPRELARLIEEAQYVGWMEAFRTEILDLVGGDSPQNKPTREALLEIGKTAGMENWA